METSCGFTLTGAEHTPDNQLVQTNQHFLSTYNFDFEFNFIDSGTI